MKEGQNRAVQFDFRWQRIPRLKSIVGPALALHNQLQ